MSDATPEDLEIRYRRLKFRSWHRGMKEMDLILGHFADTELDKLSPEELDLYEELIELPDGELYNWITGRDKTPAEHDTPLFARIRSLKHMEEKMWR